MTTVNEEWIKNFLMPKLIENEKLFKGCKDPKNVKLRDITMKLLGSDEAFMLTKCYRVKIDYEYNRNVHSNTLIVKETPDVPEEIYKSVSFDALFYNEILGYTEIIPILNILKNPVKYFYSHRKNLEAILVLEDFTVNGWRMTKSKVNLSLEHILLAAKAIGLFHGAGYALKHNDLKTFQQIVSKFRESRYTDAPKPSNWTTICELSPQRTINAAKKYSSKPIPDEFLDKLLKLMGNIFDYCKERVQPTEPMATICHGDYLRNNVAYKYEASDPEEPTDIIIFDFQTLRYSSPMIDLCIFLSLSAGKDVRQKNFDKILKTYHDELTKVYCERTGTTIDNLPSHLSYDSFLKEYILYLPYGLCIATCFLMALVDDYPTEDVLNSAMSHEELVKDVFTRGGEAVDIELSALTNEIYELTKKHNVDIFKGFL